MHMYCIWEVREECMQQEGRNATAVMAKNRYNLEMRISTQNHRVMIHKGLKSDSVQREDKHALFDSAMCHLRADE